MRRFLTMVLAGLALFAVGGWVFLNWRPAAPSAVLVDASTGRRYEIEGRRPGLFDNIRLPPPGRDLASQKRRAYALLFTPVGLLAAALLWLRSRCR